MGVQLLGYPRGPAGAPYALYPDADCIASLIEAVADLLHGACCCAPLQYHIRTCTRADASVLLRLSRDGRSQLGPPSRKFLVRSSRFVPLACAEYGAQTASES